MRELWKGHSVEGQPHTRTGLAWGSAAALLCSTAERRWVRAPATALLHITRMCARPHLLESFFAFFDFLWRSDRSRSSSELPPLRRHSAPCSWALWHTALEAGMQSTLLLSGGTHGTLIPQTRGSTVLKVPGKQAQPWEGCIWVSCKTAHGLQTWQRHCKCCLRDNPA